MKKSAVLGAVLAALVGASMASWSFAEETDMGKDGKGMMMGKKGMMGKGMMGGMMMKGMMGKSVTATSDGGVVVLTGDQLFKYDKDLALVGQAEIPVDREAMQDDMMGMMKMCPMTKGGMTDTGDASGSAVPDSGPAGTASVDEADHAAHH